MHRYASYFLTFLAGLTFFAAILLKGYLFHPKRDYVLVWSDEFESLNIETGGDNWAQQYEVWDALVLEGNSDKCIKAPIDRTEVNWWTSESEPKLLEVKNGVLSLYAHPIPDEHKAQFNNMEAFCGMIDGSRQHTQLYGYWEIRVRVANVSRGQHIAFWLVPSVGGTPPEIDLFEVVGTNSDIDNDVSRMHFTGHYLDAEGKLIKDWAYRKQSIFRPNGWNVIGLRWTPEQVTWYLNGKQVHNLDARPFGEKEVTFLASPETSGNWPGNTDKETVWPMEVQLDYVRIYQLKNGDS